MGDNPRKIDFWKLVMEKVLHKLGKWTKYFFKGRSALYQAVLAILSTYFMSMFLVPNTVLVNVERKMRSFLWHGRVANCELVI